jgi:toxin CcdB
MPDQPDVHRNSSRNSRAEPFIVVVQSNRFRASARRVVVPLVVAEAFGQVDSDFGPCFIIEGQHVVLDPPQITNVPRDVLGPAILSLNADDGRVINAMDALLSRTWR